MARQFNGDFRDWLTQVDEMGELIKLSGIHWEHEMGAIGWILGRHKLKNRPCILFDEIPGYPKGFRVLTGIVNSLRRTSLSVGLPTNLNDMQFIQEWRKRHRSISPLEPVTVSDGPILENVITKEDDLDLLMFPVPKWYERDGGRYIGTGHLVVTKDRDGWVNAGTYRVMVQDRNRLSCYISKGKHGRSIYEDYLGRGEPCPVVIVIGCDPLLLMLAGMEVPHGVSEYAFAGGMINERIPVISGPLTGLPIPANAEIAIEGEFIPGETVREGPFGEWTAHFTGKGLEVPAIRVKSILYRNNPILASIINCYGRGHQVTYSRSLTRSAMIWDQLEKAGISGVQGVYCHPLGGSRLLTVISMKQKYRGHVKQAMHVAAFCHAGGFSGRFVVVVDDDVDPSNLDDVIWAVCTRSDPKRSIEIVERCWTDELDPSVPKGELYSSRALIDGCKPFERLEGFPPEARPSEELLKVVSEKYSAIINKIVE